VVSDLVDQAHSQNPWKVLVVDDYSLKVLNTATKFFDLTNEKISGSPVLLPVRLAYYPFFWEDALVFFGPLNLCLLFLSYCELFLTSPPTPCILFICVWEPVIEKLALKRKPLKEMDAIYVCRPDEDVVNRIIEDFEGNKRLYAACHLFFLTALSDELFEKLSGSPVAKYIKTFKEANYEFMGILHLWVFQSGRDLTGPSLPLVSPSHSCSLRVEGVHDGCGGESS